MSEEAKKSEMLRQLPVNVSAETVKGHYSNVAMIVHTNREFVFDFLLAMPTDRSLLSRIILSPQHAKEFHRALGENLMRFEDQFGTISEATKGAPDEFH